MIIFDVDQTLVDSIHREVLCRCDLGVLDLAKYRQLQNQAVFDSILPLGEAFKELKACRLLTNMDWRLLTARDFLPEDYASLAILLELSEMDFICRVIHRGNIDSRIAGLSGEQDSGKYKKPILDQLARFYDRQLVMVDDCPTVLQLSGDFRTVSAYDFYSMSVRECKEWILQNC